MKRIILIMMLILFAMCFSFTLIASDRVKTINGEVVVIDLAEGSILVKKVIGKNEYINGGIIDENTEVLVSGKKGTLEDIKVKDKVTLFMTIKDEDVYVKKIVKK
ncbi:MAG TPA: hypothetical protein PLM71_02970 [Syntrophorhabdaceae bacterium]|nr:hypothetical protein [Syntrophorhabdaceae bacterium]HPU29267.1 hypothetical protein [Syntrophorhabdaceae bacterium]